MEIWKDYIVDQYKNNDRPAMTEFYKRRGMYDPGFVWGFYTSLFGVSAITANAVLINALVHDLVWQVSGFLTVVFWLITLAPWIFYRKQTHVSRRERRAIQKQQQHELEMRNLRIREQELGLPAWEYGKIES
jgi:hypothetical protein